MKARPTFLILFCMIYFNTLFGQSSKNIMSEAYYNFWNKQVQAKISADIEKYRKSDAVITLKKLPAGTRVEIEQISHDFLFGGNIFLFGDCGSPDKNKK